MNTVSVGLKLELWIQFHVHHFEALYLSNHAELDFDPLTKVIVRM
jgi:hypothetical protein